MKKILIFCDGAFYPVNNFRKKKDSVLCENIVMEEPTEWQFTFNCKNSYLKYLGSSGNTKHYRLLYY